MIESEVFVGSETELSDFGGRDGGGLFGDCVGSLAGGEGEADFFVVGDERLGGGLGLGLLEGVRIGMLEGFKGFDVTHGDWFDPTGLCVCVVL